MTAAHARRSTSQGSGKMASPVAADLIGMFAQRAAEVSAAAPKHSPSARKRLIARKAQFKKFIAEIAAEPEAAPRVVKLVAKAPAEVSASIASGTRAAAGPARRTCR